jgi:hypothetical protein
MVQRNLPEKINPEGFRGCKLKAVLGKSWAGSKAKKWQGFANER